MSIRLVTQVSALQKKILVRQFEPYSIMTRNYNLTPVYYKWPIGASF
jgi:hypothetical protein